jgi:hypothetical protein
MATQTSTIVRAGGFMVSEAAHFRAREKAVVLSGQNLKAGHVLGSVLVSATASSAARSGNTGNGVMGAVTPGNGAVRGQYTLTVIEPAANAGTFEVADPRGNVVGTGTVGVAYSAGGLAFTLADGATDFVAGDGFTITVVDGTLKVKEYNPSNTDGSQRVYGILWDAVDASAADVPGAAVVRACEINQEELTWFSGATSGQKTAALAFMRDTLGIIPRPAV